MVDQTSEIKTDYVKEKLKEIKELHEGGLLSTEAYTRLQEKYADEYIDKKYPSRDVIKPLSIPPPERRFLFISYSHRDEEWLNSLLRMLKPFIRKNSFNWNEIPEKKSRLLEFLDNFGVNWVKRAKIEKFEENIIIHFENDSLHLTLNKEKTKAKLAINDGRTAVFDVKAENHELNVYAITFWSDKEIKVGATWFEEIKNAMSSAKVAVLLVSQDFLASDFIAREELSPLLDAAREDGLTIFSIALSYCMYKETPLKKYQFANDPSRPLSSFISSQAELDRELLNICEKIKKEINPQPS